MLRRNSMRQESGQCSIRVKIALFTPLRATLAFPSGVRGPVERIALRRLASSFLCDSGRFGRAEGAPETGAPVGIRSVYCF